MLRMHARVSRRAAAPETQLKPANKPTVPDVPDIDVAKQELANFVQKNGALVFGVAAIDGFEDAPEGFRPSDLLPGAQSVVVVGGNPPRAGDWLSPLVELQETMGTSDRTNALGLKIAKFIEARYGYYALFVPPGLNKGNRPFLSVMLAAELAGCGSRSLAGPILNTEYGMLFYSAIITTLPLPADGPLETPACPAPECLEMWQERPPRLVSMCVPSTRGVASEVRWSMASSRTAGTTGRAARPAFILTGCPVSRRPWRLRSTKTTKISAR